MKYRFNNYTSVGRFINVLLMFVQTIYARVLRVTKLRQSRVLKYFK